MPLYTVQVTLKVSANTQHQAYGYIDRMIERGNKTGITHVDSEVVAEEPDESEDLDGEGDQRPRHLRKMTRQERLEGLADSGCDTWEEYRGER